MSDRSIRQPRLARREALTAIGASFVAFAPAGPAIAGLAAVSGSRFGFAPPDTPEGFMLDGKPYQVRSGEMHPARIPREYWHHRIRMAKAMGLNTIALYVMWNYHEREPGLFDFHTGNRDIAAFIRLCAAEGLWVYLRPGPYICGEWDFGGLPAYLLRNPSSHPRRLGDTNYMVACTRYLATLASIVRPMMVDRGGPIIMVQVENEYASFGADPAYLPAIRDVWIQHGITGPFSISDGLKQLRNAGTYLTGAALGLDGDTDFAAARSISKGAPVWVGEGYPGWITHWGDPKLAVGDYRQTLRVLMRDRISFNLYVVHGGTNFGFTAGANSADDGSNFQPTITSYDYGAPIGENGAPRKQYYDLRRVILEATGDKPLPVPSTPRRTSFDAVKLRPVGSIWAALPKPIVAEKPGPMETLFGQSQGLVLYRHQLRREGGELRIDGLHDEALVCIDGKPLGSLSRVAAAKAPQMLSVPTSAEGRLRQLDILVFPYGRVNFGRYMDDRKGILGDVTLANNVLSGWEIFGLPLDERHLANIRSTPANANGLFHEAEFELARPADTFIDMAGWQLGFVWVNGHSLGRHSSLGPQTRLYCPGPWLKAGRNRITVLDLYAKQGQTVRGTTMSDVVDANRPEPASA